MGILSVIIVGVMLLLFYAANDVQRQLKTFERDVKAGHPLDLSLLDGLQDRDRAEALERAIRWLHLDAKSTEAMPLVRALIPLRPHLAGQLLADSIGVDGNHSPEALELAVLLLAHRRDDDVLRVSVASSQARLGLQETALATLAHAPRDVGGVFLAKAEILETLGDNEAAAVAVKHAMTLLELEPTPSPNDGAGMSEHFHQRQRARMLAARLAGGSDEVQQLKLMAQSGDLSPLGWNNSVLLGQRMEAQLPATESVEPIHDPLARLDEVLEEQKASPHDADLLRALGVAELRMGDARRSLRWFDLLRDQHPTRFEGHLGWGLARKQQERSVVARAERLPHVNGRDLSPCLPEWNELCDLEKRVLGFVITPFLPELHNSDVILGIRPLGRPPQHDPPGIFWFADWSTTLDTTDWTHLENLARWWWLQQEEPPMESLLSLAGPLGMKGEDELLAHLEDPPLLLTECLTCWLEALARLPMAEPLPPEVKAFCQAHFQTPTWREG